MKVWAAHQDRQYHLMQSQACLFKSITDFFQS